jgi:3D (Asp-Asp-Asp) domain-containing protein
MKRLNILFAVLFLGSLTFAIVTEEKQTPQVSMDKIQERVEQVATISADVTATMYNAVTGQCDSDPLVTAGMYKINPNKASEHKWVALSRDLLKRWGGQFDYGDTIRIENAGDKSGTYTVVDTMNKRFTNKIDILETTGTDLYKYDNVKIIKIS